MSTIMSVAAFKEEYYRRYRLVQEVMSVYIPRAPRIITRNTFFVAAVEAIWMSGLSWKSARSFLLNCSFAFPIYDYKKWHRLNDEDVRRLAQELHGATQKKAVSKWLAVRDLARVLKSFKTDKNFRSQVFDDKISGKELTLEDAKKLTAMRWPYIGKVGAVYIIRRLGADIFICSRRIQKFLEEFELTCEDLEELLRKARISATMFDAINFLYYEVVS